jgi:uncharacterized membrane protein YozB (DUF420 family)
MDLPLHPTFNTLLNALAATCLLCGWRAVRAGDTERHRRWMTAAFALSAAFLASYLLYHFTQPATKYPHGGVRRAIYFAILLPHIVIAAAVVPFQVAVGVLAWRGRFDRHRALARWVWPVWMYVSVTGVLAYLMLYVFV